MSQNTCLCAVRSLCGLSERGGVFGQHMRAAGAFCAGSLLFSVDYVTARETDNEHTEVRCEDQDLFFRGGKGGRKALGRHGAEALPADPQSKGIEETRRQIRAHLHAGRQALTKREATTKYR